MKTGERERETGQREAGDQTLKPLGLGRKCNGKMRGYGKERRQRQRAGSFPHRLLGRHDNGRKTGKTGEATDGGNRACKQED